MRRRKFIRSASFTTALTTFAAVPYGIARLASPSPYTKQRQLRPPGAAWPDAEFVEACIGCGLCGEVCPPRCIRFNTREGGAQVNTPYIEPALSACTLCSKCMTICPTRALSETAVEAVDMGTAKIDRNACYPWVDKGVCGICVGICPLGPRAIDYEFANMYRPVVQDGCVGCGLCVEVCPEPSLPIRVTPRVSSDPSTGRA